jgi:thioredoxin reductase (NADPH)
MYDLIIIGAGPAGLSAGLYTGRFRLNALILEKTAVGGQIILSSVIENYPGFPGGISTQELIDKFKQQVDDLGLGIEFEEVQEILASYKFENPVYNIKTHNKSYETKSIIMATGAQSKRLGIEGEEKFAGRGVSYCGTCDGPLFKDKEIIVVGGGDRAFEEAIFLSRYAKKITVVHRREGFRASKILQDKLEASPKINFMLNCILEKISGEDKVKEVLIKNVKTNQESVIHCQGVFIFIGIVPNTAFLKNLLKLDEAGFIVTEENLATSCQGIFASGDCRKKTLYQVVTACSDGALAADSVNKYLISQK